MKLDPAVGRRRRRRFPGRTAAAGFLAVGLPVALALAGSLSWSAGTPPAGSAASCPWLSRSLPASQRVSLLLARMTLADKISMVTGAGNITAIPRLCVPP
jgi:hypothetical protein